ncbi:transcriptional regulator SplA domain-containing protein [Peribacillus sp. NPDC006672]
MNALEVQVGDEVFMIHNNPHVPTVSNDIAQRRNDPMQSRRS